MFHTFLLVALLNLMPPTLAADMVREYELRICNVSDESVTAWEEGAQRVLGWRRLRLRMVPGEEVVLILGFRIGGPDAGIVRQRFVGSTGTPLGDVTLLHHRTFSYPAFIIDELYVRASGDVSLGRGEAQSVVVRVGRAGQQVLYARSCRESDLWFFF